MLELVEEGARHGVHEGLLRDTGVRPGREWLGQVALVQEHRDNLDGYLRTIDFLTDEIGQVESWLKERMKPSRDARLGIAKKRLTFRQGFMAAAPSHFGNVPSPVFSPSSSQLRLRAATRMLEYALVFPPSKIR